MTDDHNTTWTSAPSHLDDCYWRRIFAAHILGGLLAGDEAYRNRIDAAYDGIDAFVQELADVQVIRMNKTDRGNRDE